MRECHDFLLTNHLDRITSVDDPQIHLVDVYLKRCMDGLRASPCEGIQAYLKVCDNSPLVALYRLACDRLTEADEGTYVVVMVERLRQDLELKHTYQRSQGAEKTQAAAELRQRGLLK